MAKVVILQSVLVYECTTSNLFKWVKPVSPLVNWSNGIDSISISRNNFKVLGT